MDVSITGIGTISAAGNDLDETLRTFERGESHARGVSLFPTDLTYPVFEVADLPEAADGDRMRTLDLALCAVAEALRDAGLKLTGCGQRAGVCLGTTVASQLNDIDFYRSYRNKDSVSMRPVDRYLKGNLADAVARAIGAKGPTLTVVNACSSGTDAIGVALSWLRAGMCDVAIAGGADELNPVALCGFGSLGILSESICAPFDRDRKGLNLGEGAGVLVLEATPRSEGTQRNSTLRLLGYGSSADAYHLTAPRPDGSGLETALGTAMAEAGIQPDDVSFVNAHGTATAENDRIEGGAFLRMFGPELRFLSTKGFTGHTLGAAGGLEAAFTAAALRERWIPASAGFIREDPEIGLGPVTKKTSFSGSVAVSTSLGFGGNNAAIVIERRDLRGERQS